MTLNVGTTTGRRRRRAARRLVGALAVLVIVGFFGTSPASAHSGDQSYLYLDFTPTTVSGRIETPLRDLNTVFGLDAHGTDADTMAKLEANTEALHAYFDQHLDLGAGGANWPVTFAPPTLFYSNLPEVDANYVILNFTADVGQIAVPRVIDVRFDPYFDEIPGRDNLLLIGNDWDGGVIANGHNVSSAFDGGHRVQSINLGDTGWQKTFLASAKLGVNHIRTGPDHILFILVLVLPSVLVFATTWMPTASFGASLWRVLKVVTMFTLAHSITLTLAGLEILPLPSTKIVESIIAISIAVAAIHNIRPIAPNKEWLIAFSFGLFHGMGFARLVEGLDVPRSTQLISLLGRNVGIEAGQTAVVLLMFPGLFLLRRTRYFSLFFKAVSVLLAVIALGWMIERIFTVDLGVSSRVDPAVQLPRAFVYVAAFTVIAAAVNAFERSRNRLRPVFSPAAVSEPVREPVAGAA